MWAIILKGIRWPDWIKNKSILEHHVVCIRNSTSMAQQHVVLFFPRYATMVSSFTKSRPSKNTLSN